MEGKLQGTVMNQRDGVPLGGVNLEVRGEAVDERQTTVNNGAFAFQLPSGQYELTAKKDGFEDGIYGPLVVFDDSPTTVQIALQPSGF